MGTVPTFSAAAASIQTNQQQWLRKCQLTITSSGQTYDLSQLHVEFRVVSQTVQTLRSAEITIYNLAPATAQAIFTQPEFTQVTLSAGYQNGPFSRIFSGSIAYVQWGKQDALTTFVSIVATDSDTAYNWAAINTSLAAGATPQTVLNAILDALKPSGITLGTMPPLPATQLPRAKALYGMVRDALVDFGNSMGWYWHFANGQLNFTPKNPLSSPLTGQERVVVLTPQTGLLGAPEQTLNGLNVRALLNPSIVTGGLIQVKAPLVTQSLFGNPKLVSQPDFSVPLQPGLSANGVYMVYYMTHEGNTRGHGDDWQTRMIAVATAGPNTQPITPTFINAVVDGA